MHAYGAADGVVNYSVFVALQRCPIPVDPWRKAVMSACCDGLVHVPISFYPQFYFVREWWFSRERRSASEHFAEGLRKYRLNWRSDILASAAVFVPVGVLNFRCACPSSERVISA